jgi:hypothetical protein
VGVLRPRFLVATKSARFYKKLILNYRRASKPNCLARRYYASMSLTPDIFRQVASDPAAWKEKAMTLRDAAQSLWDSFNLFLLTDSGDQRTAEEKLRVLRRFSERINISQLLYGLATEAALKARVIHADPTHIEFREKRDNEGNIVDVRIMKIGVELGKDGHDLVKLADVAGVLNPLDTGLFLAESDFIATREILAHLTDCVRWSGRYPAPKTLIDVYVKPDSIPRQALGLHLRDWLDPFLDAVLSVIA